MSSLRPTRRRWLAALVQAGALMLAAASLIPTAWSNLAQPPSVAASSSKELATRAALPQGMYAYKARLQQQVREGRFDVLQPHFEEQWRQLEQGAVQDHLVERLFNAVSTLGEADAALFDDWTNAYPQSPIGPLARAHFNLHRAWQARGERFARYTESAEFAEMNRWLPQVRRDLQLALQREPKCSLCYATLIRLSMPLGLRKEAREWFNQGMAAHRDSIDVPMAYHEALAPRWGGSTDQQAALAASLRLAGHERAARRLEAQRSAEAIAYWQWQGPAQAQRGLAEARASLAIDDSYTARYAEAYALQVLDRHTESVEAFDLIVRQYDSPVQVFQTRSFSHAQLAQWPEAMRDLRIAYEQFLSPWAFEVLVKLSAGNSGWNYRTDPGEAVELCKEAALRGLPMAMTCLGGLHHFGTGGVLKDDAQARHWFRRAAEAGDPQGMMDWAQMLSMGPGAAAERGQIIGLWIAAAGKGHPQAQGKLDSELSFGEKLRYIHWPAWVEGTSGWVRWAIRLVQFVFTT